VGGERYISGASGVNQCWQRHSGGREGLPQRENFSGTAKRSDDQVNPDNECAQAVNEWVIHGKEKELSRN